MTGVTTEVCSDDAVGCGEATVRLGAGATGAEELDDGWFSG